MTRAYNTATTQQNSGGAVAGVTAGKNLIINGAFDIWQRGTSFTGLLGNAYGADRWMFNNTTGRTYSRQSSGLDGFQYCLRVQRDSGQTSTNAPTVIYSNETVNSIPLQGKTVTLSYYARAGANFSAASSALTLDWKTGTGTFWSVPVPVFFGLENWHRNRPKCLHRRIHRCCSGYRYISYFNNLLATIYPYFCGGFKCY